MVRCDGSAGLEPVRKGGRLPQERFPIRIRRSSRRGRSDVFDLPMVVGKFHALPPTFWGEFFRCTVFSRPTRVRRDRRHPLVGPRLPRTRSRTRSRTRPRSPNFSCSSPFASSCTGTCTASLCTCTFLGPPRQLQKTAPTYLHSPLPILLCAPCDLCGSPPHTGPMTYRCGPIRFSDDNWLGCEQLSSGGIVAFAHKYSTPNHAFHRYRFRPRFPLFPICGSNYGPVACGLRSAIVNECC